MESVSQLLSHLEEARQARNEDCVRLLEDVEGIRRRRQRACVRLLQELTPHLHAVRAVDRELDRHLARRFNVFRYLRADELGLSRIIADLLDPTGDHGQGTIYLEAMLELLDPPELPEVARPTSDSGRIRVVTERGFDGRFIDITVDIPTEGGTFCLAFENKPRANDQPGQCEDYLKSLKKKYAKRFLLVYLPPRYRMPDESSLRLEDYRRHWTKHFRVLPYVADDAPHGDDGPSDADGGVLVRADSGEGHAPAEDDAPFAGSGDVPGFPAPGADNLLAEDAATDHGTKAAHADAVVGDGTSLADWFGTCCKLTDAERLRWFLREVQLHCREHFGDSTMTDTEARYVREYLDQNPRHLHAAFAVHRAWPRVREEVYRRFLEHLRHRVERRLATRVPAPHADLHVGCHYEGANHSFRNVLWIARTSWMEWADAPEGPRLSRTSILLQSHGKGMKNWRWGVRSPKPQARMAKAESNRRLELESRLTHHDLSLGRRSGWWPQWETPRYEDWDPLVPDLAQELTGGGKITDYYVNGLVGIATKAIPAIDEVELENKSPSASDDA